MKAKLLKEQMGVPAGTEMEVLETGRAWTLRAPSGADIVVPSCDVEMVPDTESFSEPKPAFDPKDPSLLVNIFGSQPQPVESDEPGDPETDPAVRDEDGNVVVNEPVTDPKVYAALGYENPRTTNPTYHSFPAEAKLPEAEPETYDFSQDPEPTEDEEPLEPHFSTAPSDDDLDEALPEPQGNCDGEACESCT